MAKKLKVIGEGGAHGHKITTPEKTDIDGQHKHLFFIGDRLLMTDLSGQHEHPVDRKNNKTGPEAVPHEHGIQVATEAGMEVFSTKNVAPHEHEIQTTSTTVSGLHTHEVELMGQTFVSLLPGDLLDEIEAAAKSIPALKDFKMKRDNVWPLEMDFVLVNRLNKHKFRKIMKTAVAKTIFKSMSRLTEGYQVERLILSRTRFDDIGVARQYVMKHGLEPKSSLEGNDSTSPFVFQIRATERFAEPLHRINITDGVIAVVGLLNEKDAPIDEPEVSEGRGSDALTENAVEPPALEPVVEGTIGEMSD